MKSLVEHPMAPAGTVSCAAALAAPAAAERAASEDPREALLETVLAHRRTVFLICLGFTRHRWDAEDLAQETWLRAQQKLGQLRDPGSARAWISRIARNVCRDHLRRMRWRRFLLGGAGEQAADEVPASETPASLAERRERWAALKRAIERLPRRMREVFVLRAYGELSYQEVADALDLPLGTVMSRLHRARAALAREVEEVGR